MTNDELEAVRARLAKATDGPWYRSGIRGMQLAGRECFRAFDGNEQWFASVSADTTNGPMHARSLADAEFIAHARTDIPALLDEVERLRAEHAVLWERAVRDSARATRAEAHAERLASALEAINALCPFDGPRITHKNSFGVAQPGRWNDVFDQARQALSAYRGEMKTVL